MECVCNRFSSRLEHILIQDHFLAQVGLFSLPLAKTVFLKVFAVSPGLQVRFCEVASCEHERAEWINKLIQHSRFGVLVLH